MKRITITVRACVFASGLVMLLPACISAVQASQADQSGAMTIAKDGKPTATIIVSADANQVVIEAVEDLQRYVEKISGAKLPIANSSDQPGNLILVGRTPEVEKLIGDLETLDLGPDGFVIRALPGKLILTGKSDGYIVKAQGPIAGRTDCGSPNAVYHFLETLGCRWYMPGDDGEVVPSKTTIEVPPLDVTSKPDIGGRWVANFGWAMGKPFWVQFGRWLARIGAGCNSYNQGHGMYGLLPRKDFAESHPEYYALVDGKRWTKKGGQFCLSNSDVVDVVSNKVIEAIAAEGPYRSYALGQYDAWNWCQCQPCKTLYGDKTFVYKTRKHARHVGRDASDDRAINTANGYLKFMNAIADNTAKVDPNCLLMYYALYNIPGFPEVKARDNVIPVMCHIVPNDKYWRQEVAKWEGISKQLYYYTYMGYRVDFLKLEIADDIRWCYEHKGVAFFLEHDAQSPVNAISQYIGAKAMWDTRVDSKKLLAEFYDLFYGAGAKPMQRFYQTFYAATRKAVRDYDCFYSYPPELTPQIAARCRGYIAEALALAKQPVVTRRIESMSRYWRATELHIAAQQALAKWKQDKSPANREAARSAVQATIDYINSVAGEFFLRTRIGVLNPMLAELNKE